MWTPKRVLLLVASLAVFLTGYEVYAHFLGGIDGLPPLPAAYVADPLRPHIDLPPQKESDADRKLRQAFGSECDEVKRPIKLDVRSRRMVLATTQVKVDEPDGRVKLFDFSLALWGNNAGDVAYPEINTITSEFAYITFDRPVSNPMEMTNRKIIACELRGSLKKPITIINNRRTPEKHDDIEVRVVTDPLFYDEKQNKIWTDGYVELQDTKPRPEPTKIRAKGMELYLARDSGKPAAKPGPTAPRPKGDTVSGVELVVLRSNVEMHLQVEAGSGFLAGEEARKPAANAPGAKNTTRPAGDGPKAAAPEMSHVVIRTQGPFQYEVARELARFDSSPANANPQAGDLELGDQVQVTREHVQNEMTATGLASTIGSGGMALRCEGLAAATALVANRSLGQAMLYDMLVCDHLELQFRRRPSTDARKAGDDQSSDKEIESAHAVSRPGRHVELSSEVERLEATGSDLYYYCATEASGPKTVLKGEPLNAIKDRNYIKARELTLVGADPKGNGQQALAKGPGQIDLFDRNNPTEPYPLHAVWRDTLKVVKDREGDRIYDLLTLTGDAAFLDDEHNQELSAQRLQVWLEPPDHAAPPMEPQKLTAVEVPRQRPHKLEAFEHVKTRSADLIIHDSEHLIVRFKDAPTGEQKLPEALPAITTTPAPTPPVAEPPTPRMELPGGAAAVIPGPALPAAPGAPSTPAAGPAATPATGRSPATPDKAGKKPIELWGRSVAAYVLRTGVKNDLQELVTEGAVHVNQEGSNPDDKGVDIKGETLNLVHHVQGDVLTVFGDARGPAELRFGEMFLSGPKVTINQRENTAEVEGVGVLNMPSNTTLEGAKPAKPGTRLTVHWNQYMFFEGKVATFHGGVVAYQEQENSMLRCKSLEVTLDRVVSFKDGQKGGQQAKVQQLVGSLDVYVVDTTRDPQGKLVRYQRLIGRGLEMKNLDGVTIATGPGKVYLLQYGSPEETVPGQTSPPASAAKPKSTAPHAPEAGKELNLTRIDFGGRMFSTDNANKTKDRTTKFYDNVEVFHQPANNPDVKVDPDHPPKGGLYLRCSLLTVFSRALPDGKTTQLMRAEHSVSFRTPEFYGTADIVKYDQSKEQIIFEGVGGNNAVVYRLNPAQGPGVEPTGTMRARLILYDRKTGRFDSGGGREIIGR
jgi:hypothetical protein